MLMFVQLGLRVLSLWDAVLKGCGLIGTQHKETAARSIICKLKKTYNTKVLAIMVSQLVLSFLQKASAPLLSLSS